MKKGMVIVWLALLFSGMAVLFWRSEWVYSLPTPVPAHYKAVKTGQHIDLSAAITAEIHSRVLPAYKKPVFLHFFNPDCPCSRFNMAHFKSLVKQYGQEVNFAIVLVTDKKYTAGQILDKFNLDRTVPVLADTTLASSCGVYSTPQAVLIDTNQNLFYRGNYNRSRYCSDDKSSYARIALDDLLHNDLTQNFSPLALKAYGCQLPTCNR